MSVVIVHLCRIGHHMAPDSDETTLCCGLPMAGLLLGDRLDEDPALTTCAGRMSNRFDSREHVAAKIEWEAWLRISDLDEESYCIPGCPDDVCRMSGHCAWSADGA